MCLKHYERWTRGQQGWAEARPCKDLADHAEGLGFGFHRYQKPLKGWEQGGYVFTRSF